MIYIDFETRSLTDLKKVGASKYARDLSTKVLCLAYDLDDGAGVKLWVPGDDPPLDLIVRVRNGQKIEAHNSQFEFCVWNYCAVREYNFPELKPDQLYCSLAKGSALSLPRGLDALCNALDTDVKKDKEGHRVMLQLTKPRKPTKNNPKLWVDDPEKFEKLYQYCIDDVKAEKACSEIMPDLSKDEEKVYQLDQKINVRGIYCDTELCRIALKFTEIFQEKLLIDLKEITGGQVQTAKQVKKIVAFLKMNGLNIDNLQAATVEEKLKENIPEIARKVLEIRFSLGKSSVTKFKKMLDMADYDNRIRGTLLYHGASTGRFSGKGIQPHNYIKPAIKDTETLFKALEMNDFKWFETLYPEVINALSSTLRGMLRAAPGNELYSADWNAIEARAVFWLAGCETGLKVFRAGEDIYKEMATVIYNVLMAEVTGAQRQLGKQAILGLGFQMGAKKFVETCAGYGIIISLEFAERIVKIYRGKYSEIKDFWGDAEKAAIQAIKTKRIVKLRNLKFGVEKNFLFIRLPSGRKLAYYDPKIKVRQMAWGAKESVSFMGVDSMTHKWERQYTYGGKLVENITQAVARDIMVFSMLRAEEKGFEIILTVHDEIIAENKISFSTLENFVNVLLETPKWAEGFPSKIDAWKGLRYRK